MNPNRFGVRSAAERAAKSASRERDYDEWLDETVTRYVAEIDAQPRWDGERRRAACQRVVDTRRRLRAALLRNDFVLRAVVRLLRQARDGQARLERVLEVTTSDADQMHSLRRRLSANLPTVERLVVENRAAVRRASNWRADAQQRAGALRQLIRRRRHAAKLVEELTPRTRQLRAPLAGLVALARCAAELEELRRAVGGDRGGLSATLRLTQRRLARRAGLPLAALKRRVARLRTLDADYEAAKAALCVANLQLVLWQAQYHRVAGKDLADLIQEGNLGLMRAVEKYDSRRGATFSTYAIYWIRQAMQQAAARWEFWVPVSLKQSSLIFTLSRVAERLYCELGRQATSEEMAARARMPSAQVERTLKCQFSLLPPLSWRKRMVASSEYLTPGTDILATARDPTREEARRAALEPALLTLRPRELDIVRRRFGLDGAAPLTLQEIGIAYRLSRERIRQIEFKALRKLRRLLTLDETFTPRDDG